jgi:hypothetical protein
MEDRDSAGLNDRYRMFDAKVPDEDRTTARSVWRLLGFLKWHRIRSDGYR